MKLYKKYSILCGFAFTIFAISSCSSELDLLPEQSVSPNQIGQSEVTQLLNGVYNKSTTGIGNRFTDFDLLANHFIGTPLFAGTETSFVQNRLSPTQTEQWWSELYAIIHNANTLLEAIDGLPASSVTAENEANQTAEYSALYLRGLAYYNLVTRFGGVPLLSTPTREVVQRSTAQETWDFIISDLTAALSLAGDFSNKNFVSKEAIQALLARVYIATGNTTEAQSMAEAVIASTAGGFALTTDFASTFTSNGNSEVIFSLGNNPIELVNPSQYNYFNTNGHPINGSYRLKPTDDVITNLFDAGDLRSSSSITVFDGFDMVNKYTSGRNLPVIVSRLAEMYLISAEAQGYPAGATRLNELRANRGLGATSATDTNSFIDAILDERQKEFYAEGFYWYDLVRTGKAIERLDNVTEQNQLLLPIPQREIDLTGLTPNPGY